MPPGEEEGSIERLQRTLYSRNEKVVPKEKRTPVQGRDFDVQHDWGAAPKIDVTYEDLTKKNNAFFNKFLLGSGAFLFLSLLVAGFIFFGGINMISSNNLDIKIVAPSSVLSGEEATIGLSVVNANRTDLENVTLYIDYPEGSQSVEEGNKILSHDSIDLDTIGKGESKDYTIRALVFGEKDSIKTFNLRLEYKVKGSNAVFSKEKNYDLVISSSPVILNVDYPKNINSGQTIKLSINIVSNSSAPLKNSILKIEYPYGFTYTDSNIKPLRNNSVWNIGDLKNGDKKTLEVSGIMVGQNEEERSFRISLGTPNSANTSDFSTPLVEETATLSIQKSFFDLSVSAGQGTTLFNTQSFPVNIKWQNTLPDKMVNNNITVTIGGNSVDRNNILPNNGGFYQSANNNIVWDKNTTSDLTTIIPGDSGNVGFNISSLSNTSGANPIKNPHIDLHVVMSGDRTGSEVTNISSSQDLTIKVLSTVNFRAQTFRDVGPLTNVGPIPPKAEKETTYTVTFTVTNTSNDLKDTTVTASLPQGVSWKGETSPSSERIIYNPDNRTISWNVGNVSYSTGYVYSPRTISFKVGLTPSLNQVGQIPQILTNIQFSSTDTYVNQPIKINSDPLSTFYSDPGFRSGNEVVTK